MKIIVAFAWPIRKQWATWHYFRTQQDADDFIKGFGNGVCCYTVEEVKKGLFDKSIPEKAKRALRSFLDYYASAMPEKLK